jgi:hypothetical protein
MMGGGEFSRSSFRAIEGGRTPVLEVAETAATVVLWRGGNELARLPIVLRPGEVNLIRW